MSSAFHPVGNGCNNQSSNGLNPLASAAADAQPSPTVSLSGAESDGEYEGVNLQWTAEEGADITSSSDEGEQCWKALRSTFTPNTTYYKLMRVLALGFGKKFSNRELSDELEMSNNVGMRSFLARTDVGLQNTVYRVAKEYVEDRKCLYYVVKKEGIAEGPIKTRSSGGHPPDKKRKIDLRTAAETAFELYEYLYDLQADKKETDTKNGKLEKKNQELQKQNQELKLQVSKLNERIKPRIKPVQQPKAETQNVSNGDIFNQMMSMAATHLVATMTKQAGAMVGIKQHAEEAASNSKQAECPAHPSNQYYYVVADTLQPYDPCACYQSHRPHSSNYFSSTTL